MKTGGLFQISEHAKYSIACLTSVVISLAGIPFAAYVTGRASDGGRGGAIGTAIALVFMFLNRDIGFKLYSAIHKLLPEQRKSLEQITGAMKPENDTTNPDDPKKRMDEIDKKVAEANSKLDDLENALGINAKGQRRLNIYLAITTCIGTISWGFGDMAAQWIIDHHH